MYVAKCEDRNIRSPVPAYSDFKQMQVLPGELVQYFRRPQKKSAMRLINLGLQRKTRIMLSLCCQT